MASLAAIMTKRGQAKKRIDAATEKLVEIFGIDVPPAPGNVAQSELRHALELDRLATILESILESTDPGRSDDGEDGDDSTGAEPTGAETAQVEPIGDSDQTSPVPKPAATPAPKSPAKPAAKPAKKPKGRR